MSTGRGFIFGVHLGLTGTDEEIALEWQRLSNADRERFKAGVERTGRRVYPDAGRRSAAGRIGGAA